MKVKEMRPILDAYQVEADWFAGELPSHPAITGMHCDPTARRVLTWISGTCYVGNIGDWVLICRGEVSDIMTDRQFQRQYEVIKP